MERKYRKQRKVPCKGSYHVLAQDGNNNKKLHVGCIFGACGVAKRFKSAESMANTKSIDIYKVPSCKLQLQQNRRKTWIA